jgi:HEAT repeat protein
MLHFNVSNGGTCFSAVDFSPPGFISFEFELNYKRSPSSRSPGSTLNYCRCLGWNWSTPLDAALLSPPSGFSFRDQWAHAHALEPRKNAPPEERLVHLGDRRDIGPLFALLKDESDTVRENAIKALDEMESTEASEPLIAMAASPEETSWVRSQAIRALGPLRTLEAVELLCRIRDREEDQDVREAAVEALAALGNCK